MQDLALLSLLSPCHDVVPVKISEQHDDSQIGDEVIVSGFPKGVFEVHTMKVGEPHLFFVAESYGWRMATMLSGDIRPGNSGGPVVSVRTGKLVGIVHGYSDSISGKPGIIIPLMAITYFMNKPD